MSTKEADNNSNKKIKTRRIVALIGAILICIMVIATLITAIADKSGVYFRSCLIVTIALPIALWVFMWAYGAMTHTHTPASFDFGGDMTSFTPDNTDIGNAPLSTSDTASDDDV